MTGGHGFIGAPLARRLASLGAHVHAVSRSTHPDDGEVRSHAVDLADEGAVMDLFAALRPDFVLHLASDVIGVRTPDVVASTLRNNLVSTVNLLLAAQRHGCRRVVLTGSLEEPEATGEPAIPSSPYAAAKFAASAYGRMFNALFGLSVVILRVFMVYGPGQKDLRKLIPYVVTSLSQGKTPSFTSGARLVDWIYVDDVVDAFVCAVNRRGIDGQTIDIGSGQLISVKNIVEMLFQAMGAATPPGFGEIAERPMEQVRQADVAAAKRLLAWEPRVSLASGLNRTIAAYAGSDVAVGRD